MSNRIPMRPTDCLTEAFADLRAHSVRVALWDCDARECYFDAVAEVLIAMRHHEQAWACAVLLANDLAVRYGIPQDVAMVPVWSRVMAGWEQAQP